MKVLSKRAAAGAAALPLSPPPRPMASQALAGSKEPPASAKGLGPISGLLPRDHLTEESAIQVDLSKESVRLPLYKGVAYKGTPQQETVWSRCSMPRIRASRTTSASTTRPSSATSRSATRRPCRR